MILRVLAVLVLLIGGAMIYVRLAPSNPVAWHTDPTAATAPARGGWLIRPEGGSGAAPVFATDPAALLAALDKVAMAGPRTLRLAGSVEEGRITYISRSRLWGFPDYTTVTTVAVGEGAAPVIWARQRFGAEDLGVNRARVEGWLTQLAEVVPPLAP